MHYVIVGNGVCGITAAFTLRSRDSKARITVISGESDYFFSRTALMYAFMDRMNHRDLEPYERKVYDRQRIERRRAWVGDLDARRKRLRLDNGEDLAYDRLLLATGSRPNSVDWPGLGEVRDGVVHFVSLQDLAECERLAPTTRQAAVVGGGLIGVELVECLVHHGIAVRFFVRADWYWPMALGPEEGEMIGEHIRRHGVDLRFQEEVERVEAGPDGRVARVISKRGLEYSCEMFGITIGVRPSIDWLRGVTTPPELGRGIKVGPDFRTSCPDVWAAGDCAEIDLGGERRLVEQIWYSARRQGELAARSMLGDRVEYKPPLFYNSAKFFEIEYTTVGKVTGIPEAAVSFSYRAPDREAAVRIVEHGGAVIGFNMLGSRWNHAHLERWIHERRSLGEVVERLHEAQFDVEFGRLDLRPLRRRFEQWRDRIAA